jgi:hypothetical protein
LVHFVLGVDVDRAVFGAMIGFTAMVYAVQRSCRVWSSASPATFVRSYTPLVALGRPLAESSGV